METSQLILIDDQGDDRPGGWRIDERTREVGRKGGAEARRALAEALAHRHDDRHPTAA